MAKIKGQLARAVKAYCEECRGSQGTDAVCRKLQNNKPCPLHEWWMKPEGEVRAAIRAVCRFCMNGHYKALYCVSPSCAFFQSDREEEAA